MLGYLRTIPLRTRRNAARVVSRKKSAANGGAPGAAGAGQLRGVDEHHRRARVQRGEEVVLALLAEVGARAVGEQYHAGASVSSRGLGDPAAAVAWLVNALAPFETPILPGQFVMSGSFTTRGRSSTPAMPPSATIGGLGTVSVTFV